MMKIFLFGTVLLFSISLHAQKVFLIGDAGEPRLPHDTNLAFLERKIEPASENDVLIFLGDNIYPKGLPEEDSPLRPEMEKKLNAQLDIIKKFKGKSFLIPGNHDWAKGKSHGWQQIIYQAQYASQYLEKDGVFQPKNGCPGPIEIQVSDKVTLIILDTQYLLHPWDKPREESPCLAKSSSEALQQLEDMVIRNRKKHLLVVGHHPLYTYGVHNGLSSFKQHIFPLTDTNKKLYIPLPVIGSIYPLYRKYLGNIQDVPHPKYRAIRKILMDIFSHAPNLVYASGHEHSLEYIKKDSTHFIVSGSGSKTSPVKKGSYTEFFAEKRGFTELSYEQDGKVNLKIWNGDNSSLLYSHFLYHKEVVTDRELVTSRPAYGEQTFLTAASDQYKAGPFKNWLLGKNYREVWSTSIEFPVFDITQEYGGLSIIKRGGGMQTRSLRMQAGDGKQYVLRSIEKYAENAIPSAIRKTFAADLVQDQISSSHPYGAIVIPPLAEAANIYHTNPRLVYIPDDPLLGKYQNTFSGLVALYEERPNNAAAGDDHFGNAEKIRSTFDVLEALYDDNDNRVDQPFVVRNRLFDMWIGDWDRHDDQWRWARFDDPDGKGKLYRPIPRDRDQAFFVNQGLIPKIVSRKWALPKIEGFDEMIDWAPGFNHNARYFDRTFMNQPTWDVWRNQIEQLQTTLTDEVIENAISSWPGEVYEKTAPTIIGYLKYRRDHMEEFAKEHYLFLSKEVEVVGSGKNEYFLVERLDDQATRVTVYKIDKNKNRDRIIYERTFDHAETREVRLFGLAGKDEFELRGDVDKGIKVRIIGGKKKDTVNDQSSVKGAGKKTVVYDLKKNTTIQSNGETRSRLSDDPVVNYYDRKSFRYSILMPLLTAQFNPDDGIFLGGGVLYTKNKWRKDPYAAKHQLTGSAAFATGSFNARYKGHFTDVIGKWGLELSGEVQAPFFVNNFFGLGNESVFDFEGTAEAAAADSPIDYYRIRSDRGFLGVKLTRNLGNSGQFYFGSISRSASVEIQNNKFLTSGQSTIDVSKVAREHAYSGGTIGIAVDNRDDKVLPSRGLVFNVSAEQLWGVNDRSEDFTNLSAEFGFYLSARVPSVLTLANRVGVEHIIGNYEFFNAATLGGRSNLRGFRRTRFYGETAFYHNLDVRLRLFSFRSYLFPGRFGVLGFMDTARVWLEGENSTKWHQGKGFGLWLSPAGAAVITLNLAFTKEENLPSVGFGFFF